VVTIRARGFRRWSRFGAEASTRRVAPVCGPGLLRDGGEKSQSSSGAPHSTAVPDGPRLLPSSASIYCYLICLGIIAGATVAACYASALALLQQPMKGLSAALVPDRGVGVAVVPRHLAAADATISRFGVERPPNADRGEAALRAASRAPSHAKPPPPGPRAIARANARNATPPSAEMSPSRPPAGTQPSAAPRLPEAEIAALAARGDDLLRLGDIASARLYYERAADAGGEQAAFRMAATFDPLFLSRIGAQSMAGDPAKARFWYGRARALGALKVRPAVSSAATN
jgi:hypothetical protein